jgi:D-alanyl-lipoteichoic acid acyltransferase DltB (MBOAT superfamily)
MQFDSYSFLLFLGLVLAVHRSRLPWSTRKLTLLVASYLFYAAWNPPFVLLLAGSTLADWFIARAIATSRTPARKRAFLVLSLCVNLGVLGFFKYGGFLLENFIALVSLVGFEYQAAAPSIVLPVGISFYTFQTLSYTIDVYRDRARPWHSFRDYALYVSFFPQLVAGPIVRSSTFLPQCEEERRASPDQLGRGVALLVLGLFMKVVVADGLLAPVSERVFAAGAATDFASAWLGVLAFAGQIFCDFAGYSTCAIGVALALGFELPTNFQFPYAATGFADFWRRWHISLSSWLRDYLYIPLGGNRCGVVRARLNLMLTMLLGGLWHGASWNFVLWGALHGLFLVAERPLLPLIERIERWPARLGLCLVTFSLVCVAWVPFRAATLDKTGAMLSSMLMATAHPRAIVISLADQAIVLGTICILLTFHFVLRDVSFYEALDRVPWWIRSLLLASMLIAIVTMPGEDRSFIYFQF